MLKKGSKFLMLMFLSVSLFLVMFPSSNANAATFAKGADIGWLNQLENQGIKWQDVNGVSGDCLQILKNNGINAVRLRVFVNPPSSFQWTKIDGTTCYLGYGDTTGVIYMAKRAKALGMKVMIDFHYSDHFADPAYQDIPSAWVNHSFEQLKTDVYSHTYYLMKALADEGITPDWVQVGNEINSGMLWPYGSTSNFWNLAALINQGYYAVKDVSPSSKVVIHVSNGYDNSLFRYVFDGLTKAGAKYDVIGMSYYPYWTGVDYKENIDDLEYNMKDMVSRYNKEVIISEIGGLETDANNTYNMIKDVIKRVKNLPNGKGIGVFYWEPEANSSVLPDSYPLGATKKISYNTLRFTKAITAFK